MSVKPIFHCDGKYLVLGVGVGPKFCIGDTNMLVSCSQRKPLNLRHPRRQTRKFALPLPPTPDASQWNIGGVGPSGVWAGVGHVHFMFFVLISS